MKVKLFPHTPPTARPMPRPRPLSLPSPLSFPRSFVLAAPRPSPSPTACLGSGLLARVRLSLLSFASVARSGSARAVGGLLPAPAGCLAFGARLVAARLAAASASLATLACSLRSPALCRVGFAASPPPWRRGRCGFLGFSRLPFVRRLAPPPLRLAPLRAAPFGSFP